MQITYQLSANAWDGYPVEVRRLMEHHHSIRLCDIGGGANPILPLDYIARYRLQYTLLDISRAELDKAPPGYRTVLADICDPAVTESGPYDFVFSCMVAEHIRDAKIFYANIFNMLAPGGIAFHYFPTLYALPFLANKIIPERLSAFLLNIFAQRDRRQRAKFPAYYNWTFGPTPAQINRLTSLGYNILEYRGLYGHIYYNKIPLLRNLHRLYSNYLVKHPNSYLTSFAYLILQKPNS